MIAHIDHRGCECADARIDTLRIIREARRNGGDERILGGIAWHIEDRVPLQLRIEYQARFGSVVPEVIS